MTDLTNTEHEGSRYVGMPSPRRGERVLGLSRATIYRLAGSQKIRIINVGRKSLVDVKSVADYLDNLPAAPIAIDSRTRAA